MRSKGYSTWFVLSFRLSGLSVTMRNKPAKERYQLVQDYMCTGLILKNGDFRKSTAFKSYGMKNK